MAVGSRLGWCALRVSESRQRQHRDRLQFQSVCGEVCYGQFRRLSLHRLTTVAVRTGAEEAVARLLTSGTLDLGGPEVCQGPVDQVAGVDREDRVERHRLEDHGMERQVARLQGTSARRRDAKH